jgi:uncharacterized protein YodC (DUF2158 family)
MSIKTGDVVQLASGGPLMTVTHCQVYIEDDEYGRRLERVNCEELDPDAENQSNPTVCTVWMREGIVDQVCVPEEALKLRGRQSSSTP